MQLEFWEQQIPFEYPFTISNGRTKTHQQSLMVKLSLANWVGHGEAPAIAYYNVTVTDMIEKLEKQRKLIEKFALIDPERFWHFLHHLFPQDPFLVCALDMAGWDLFGQMKKQPLHEMWNTPWDKNVVTPICDYTLGIDTIDKMVEKMNTHPWPIYKVKVGTDYDIEMMTALRQHTDKPLRVDANAGWTTEEALLKIPALAKLGVELVEQPLAKDNWEGMIQLKKQSALPLFADESCVFEKDVAICAEYFHGINIKLTKCSGPTPALRMIKEAKHLGLKVMMGSMNESVIGSAAIAQFLPQLDYVDMDGPILMTQLNAVGLNYSFENKDGKIAPLHLPGLGVQYKQPFNK
ncbi:MAG: dipeptide epimerase [Bacteroidetes bacterium]|nr:dipeptide epimerase [Bacteroidota bacterium]